MRIDTVWTNANLARLSTDGPDPFDRLGRVSDGVVAVHDGRIVYAGPRTGMPALDPAEVVDCGGRWITPGLIDCHTHLVYAGNRAREFELALTGASYEEIARAGGGIVATVSATRRANESALLAATLRLRWPEYGQRLVLQQRAVLSGGPSRSVGANLVAAALAGGGQACGQGGGLLHGQVADLIVLNTDHPLLVGHNRETQLDAWVFAGNASLVREVVVDGQMVVRDRRHALQDTAARDFARTMRTLGA